MKLPFHTTVSTSGIAGAWRVFRHLVFGAPLTEAEIEAEAERNIESQLHDIFYGEKSKD